MCHGKGIYLFNDGDIYNGHWKDNKKHGKGVLTWPDGARYEGGW